VGAAPACLGARREEWQWFGTSFVLATSLGNLGGAEDIGVMPAVWSRHRAHRSAAVALARGTDVVVAPTGADLHAGRSPRHSPEPLALVSTAREFWGALQLGAWRARL